jgi:hypothetical protein
MFDAPRKYLLRWRYDYPEGSAYGMWSNPGTHKSNQAWCQNKEGLVRASVEGKDLVTKKVVTLAECDGHSFRVFQWMAAARVPGMITGSIKPMSQLIGMKLLTADRELSVFDTGYVHDKPLGNGERLLNFATYGK